MASPAAASRARRLSSIFSSTTSRAQTSKPAPILKIVKAIVRERDPGKLVSRFIAASVASQSFREEHHRVYTVAVDRLTHFGRQDAVAAILDSQKPFLEDSTEVFAERLIRLYGRASMPSHAATTFHDLPPKHKSVTTFNALLSAYVNARDFDGTATAFQQIPASHPAIAPSVYSYNILIRALCRKPDLSAALDVIPLMEKCGLSPNEESFSILLNGFYDNGRFDDAEKFWEMMKERNVQPDVKCYNAKLGGLVAQGRIQDAVAVIEAMQKDGPKPDSVCYNELIRGYCKEGKLGEAKKVYDDMVNNECAPNKGTFETLVPHFVEAGELDLALNCCHEIFSRKCRVKCSLLQGVVTALVAASRVDEATNIVELGWKNSYTRIHSNIPALARAAVLNLATGEVEVQPNAGRSHAKALRKISKFVFKERDPDKLVSQFIAVSTASQSFREKPHVYEVAVARLISFGRCDAIATILDSQKPFLEASGEDFAGLLIRLYGRASLPSHAAATFHELPPKHKSIMTFNALLVAYLKARDFDVLAAAFEQIPASHPTIVPNVYSYNILISALCQKPDPSAALDVIQLMEKCGLTPNELSFSLMLNVFYDNSCFDDAKKLWEMMNERNVQPDIKCYNAKLRCLVAQGRIQDAIAVIGAMQKVGHRPDSVSYSELIRGYCKEGRLGEAKEVYDLVKNECAPNKETFETLLPQFVEAGELDLALNCCHEIFSRKCRVKCSLLQGLVTALIAASRVEEATSIVELGWKNNYTPMDLNVPALIEKDKVVEAETDCGNSVRNDGGERVGV